MESHLLDILVCPICKSSLQYDRPAQELICKADKLAFPVRDGIPVMLENEARTLSAVQPSDAPTQAPDAPDAQAESPGSPE
ncbi:Trm112 family protein [Pusillimonas sp.]|uniref:Trm112 family protein n=1 Tax=Pusillimonas sp. TaxID=3040095 RepID=UPI0037CBEDAD